jgi:hypothetical protein
MRRRLQGKKMPAVTADETAFARSVTTVDRFERIVEQEIYRPLPDGWWIGVTDVQGSTRAISQGRYKAVNMAGACAISGLMNALDHRDFPFVFGGDGAGFAVSGGSADVARTTLSRSARWVADELGLSMRAALVPLDAIRSSGCDVRVANFAASPDVAYTLAGGGGFAWAEAQMRAGRYTIEPAPPGERPDLTGLSCRWTPVDSQRGRIVSLLVAPGDDGSADAFATAVRDLLGLLDADPRAGRAVPDEGPGFNWPPQGLDYEARATRQAGRGLLGRRLAVGAQTLIAWILDRSGIRLGGFDPAEYKQVTGANTDFRKFDDMLRMTIDCDSATLGRIRRLLAEAQRAGVVRYGLWEQDSALMTCIVPSPMRRDHMHFLDGADGGYARAAAELKGGMRGD